MTEGLIEQLPDIADHMADDLFSSLEMPNTKLEHKAHV